MATQIARKGRAVTIEIPEEMLRKANLSVGDAVEWTLTPAGWLALRSSRHAKAEKPADGYDDWNSERFMPDSAKSKPEKAPPTRK